MKKCIRLNTKKKDSWIQDTLTEIMQTKTHKANNFLKRVLDTYGTISNGLT